PGLGHDLLAREEAELDADAREADAAPPDLGARPEVVITTQLAATHTAAVIHDVERGCGGIGGQADLRGPGIEGVRDDLGEDGLLERARIRIAQVLEEVEQVNPGFAHGGSPGKAYACAGPGASVVGMRRGEEIGRAHV